MKSIFKKWWFWVSIIVIIILLLMLRGCKTRDILTIKLGIGDSVKQSITRRGGDSIEIIDVDTLIRDLVINLEPLNIDCIMEEGECLGGCFEGELPCEDDLIACDNACDEEFPITDEIEECWDGCDNDGDSCIVDCETEFELIGSDYNYFTTIELIPAAYAIADGFADLDECEHACYEEWDNCDYECDRDWIECNDECGVDFFPFCFEDIIDCIYICLEDCVIGEEVVEWDGSEITNIGEFFEISFPQFTEQFYGICEWLMFGDYISNENKFGCVGIIFWGDWFAPYLDSIESMENVCTTIGGEFIIGDGEISCNI